MLTSECATCLSCRPRGFHTFWATNLKKYADQDLQKKRQKSLASAPRRRHMTKRIGKGKVAVVITHANIALVVWNAGWNQ